MWTTRFNAPRRGRTAQWRPARLEAGPLAAASGWIGDYRPFWEESFDALAHHLAHLQKGTTHD